MKKAIDKKTPQAKKSLNDEQPVLLNTISEQKKEIAILQNEISKINLQIEKANEKIFNNEKGRTLIH